MQNTELPNRLDTTWWALRLLFGIVPIVAGLDKYFNLLTNWTSYLNPLVTKVLPITGPTFMHIVGVIEIVAGVIVLSRWTQLGSYIVIVWPKRRDRFQWGGAGSRPSNWIDFCEFKRYAGSGRDVQNKITAYERKNHIWRPSREHRGQLADVAHGLEEARYDRIDHSDADGGCDSSGCSSLPC